MCNIDFHFDKSSSSPYGIIDSSNMLRGIVISSSVPDVSIYPSICLTALRKVRPKEFLMQHSGTFLSLLVPVVAVGCSTPVQCFSYLVFVFLGYCF